MPVKTQIRNKQKKASHVFFPDLWFLSYKIQRCLHELELTRNCPEINFLNLENQCFENVRFFQSNLCKSIFDILLLINQFIFLIDLRNIHWKKPGCKFKIDKLTYSKSVLNNRSLYQKRSIKKINCILKFFWNCTLWRKLKIG